MPVASRSQRRFLGAELARLRAGKKRQTDMTEAQLTEYLAGSKDKKLPERKLKIRRK